MQKLRFVGLVLVVLAAAPASAYQSLTVFPTWMDFNQVEVNGTGISQTISVRNSGDEDLNFFNLSNFGDSFEFRTMSWCPMNLTRYASCTITVEFTPHSSGYHTLDLVISGGNQREQVSVRGEGIEHRP